MGSERLLNPGGFSLTAPCELGEALAPPAAPGPGRVFSPVARAPGDRS